MKKAVFLLMVLLIGMSNLMGQATKTGKTEPKTAKTAKATGTVTLKKLSGNAVSAEAKYNFSNDFGAIPNVTWKRSTYFDEATFANKGIPTVAFYDMQGMLVGTTSAGKFSDLPKRAQEDIKSKYGTYTPGAIIFFDDNEANSTDMYLYDLQFPDEDSYFVEMTKGTEKIVLQVHSQGEVDFFTTIK